MNSLRGRWPERVEELVTAPLLGLVQILRGDAVDVGGVLDERAARVAQVPEPVGTDRMATQAPGVATGIDVDHVLAAPHHVVDRVHLERDVVDERYGGRLNRHVVMYLAAARERHDAGDLVADLESEHVVKKRNVVV